MTPEPVQPVLPEQSYSIEDIISKLAQEKGYFTMEDWKFKVMLLPVQHPLQSDEDQAKQRLENLLKKGRIRELEPGTGKYQPTTTEMQNQMEDSWGQ